MKKILASLLAAAMAVSLSSVAFALPDLSTSSGATSGTTGSTTIWPGTGTATAKDLTVEVPLNYKGEVDLTGFTTETFPIYTYGSPDNVEFNLEPVFVDTANVKWSNAKFKNITAHVNSGNISVTIKKNDGTTWNGKKAPSVKIKATSGGRDFKYDDEHNDLSVDLDVTMVSLNADGSENLKYDSTITLKADASTAYSKTIELLNDEDIHLSKANGTIVKFSDAITDKTRVRCSDYVDVYFKGNYGTNKQNMRVITDSIPEIDTYFADTNTNVYDFTFTPKFASSVLVSIDADPNASIYEYNKKTGDITKLETNYESNAATFETKAPGCYIVADDEYEDGNVKADGDVDETIDEEPIDTGDGTTTPGTEGEKQNPETGANDLVGAAAAMAVVSLLAAGAVAFKKATK